jgi:MFS family permease
VFPPALRYRKYRLLGLGLLISVSGSRMHAAAVLWQVHDLSGEPIALAGVGLSNILPVIVFSVLAGVAADAFNRRHLILVTQSTLALLALLLGWLTLAGRVQLWSIYLISAMMSAALTFDLPARQALIPNLLPREVLPSAFGVNATIFHLASIVGPVLAGAILATSGVGLVYVINAVSFLAVIGALIAIGPVAQERTRPAEGTAWRPRQLADSAGEGLRHVMGQPLIFSSMLLDFFATFFASATYLLPIFAKDILHVGAVGYGWLVAAPSVGAGLASLYLAFRHQVSNQGRKLLIAVAGFGLATIAFGLSRTFPVTLLALTVTGATDAFSTIIRNTLRQLQTPDRLRGRMTGILQVFFLGGPQLGEVEAGVVAQLFGATAAVVSGGIACVATTGWVAVRYPQLRNYRGDEPVPQA